MSQISLAPHELIVPPVLALQLHTASSSAPDQIGVAMHDGFRRLDALLKKHQLQMAAPPRAIYHAVSPASVSFTLAIPITATPSVAPGLDAGTEIGVLPEVRALCFTHHGPYERLAATYREITGWLQEHGLIETEADWSRFMPMWEEYVSDPDQVPADELVTNVYLPIG